MQQSGTKNASNAIYAMVGTTQVVLAYQAPSTTSMWRTLPYPGPVAEAVVCPSSGDGTPHCSITRSLLQNHQQPQ